MFILCVCVSSAYVYVDCICAWCILMLEEGLGSAETGIAGGCELPCLCSELNLVLCIINKCSELLHHLSSLITTFPAFSKQPLYQKTVTYFFVLKKVKHLREKLIGIFYIWFPILIVCVYVFLVFTVISIN